MPFAGSVFWLVAFAVFCVIEGLTYSLVCIWFACGALLAIVASLFGFNVASQYAVFLIASAVLLCFTRPVVKRYISTKKVRTNADRVIGKPAVVLQRVDPVEGVGQVRVLGQIWSARPADGVSSFEVGETVTVMDIAGVKVLVAYADANANANPQ
jgi:membrane protein implicated in regulation of membrane protease activity